MTKINPVHNVSITTDDFNDAVRYAITCLEEFSEEYSYICILALTVYFILADSVMRNALIDYNQMVSERPAESLVDDEKYVYRVNDPIHQSTMIYSSKSDALDHIERSIAAYRNEGLKVLGMSNVDSDWIENPTMRTIEHCLDAREWVGISLERRNDGNNEPMFTEYRIEIEKHLLF